RRAPGRGGAHRDSSFQTVSLGHYADGGAAVRAPSTRGARGRTGVANPHAAHRAKFAIRGRGTAPAPSCRRQGRTMKRKSIFLTALWTSIALAAPAHAQDFRGEDQISGSLGGRVALHDAESGGLFAAEYGHRLSKLTWLDLELDLGFGGGRVCFLDRGGGV